MPCLALLYSNNVLLLQMNILQTNKSSICALFATLEMVVEAKCIGPQAKPKPMVNGKTLQKTQRPAQKTTTTQLKNIR